MRLLLTIRFDILFVIFDAYYLYSIHIQTILYLQSPASLSLSSSLYGSVFRARIMCAPIPSLASQVERKAGDRAGSEDDEDGGSLLRMSENSLNLCLLGAAVGGMTLGWHIRNHGVSARLLQLIDFPGELYMRMLECLVMPVVASSIVAGLGSVDIMLAGQIGLLAMLYFVVATGMASAIGIGVALVLGPQNEPYCRRQFSSQIDGFLDLLRNLFPDNYLAACLLSSRTYIAPQNDSGLVDDENIYLVMNDRTNILGLLSVSVMLGAVLSVTASESDSLLNLFVGLSNATVTVSQLTAWVSPVGVFFLVATRLSQTSELDHAFVAMRTLLLVSVAALAAYGLGLLPVLYVLVTRKVTGSSPWHVWLRRKTQQGLLPLVDVCSAPELKTVLLRRCPVGANYE
ncbi:neutral amino acid transporter B(0)-like [Dermacentor andersoni]|uniref:neutral amino acid transporter B(0)-like n=1 Tax=Dermacentor andersoni TaxID=34620 RepID=UPI0024178B3E|nr:neutral amino acid transporter B(0)-like [Dermacentor andersoni]